MESPFRSTIPSDLLLIETFGRQDGAFIRLDDHLARLARTATMFGVPFDRAAIDQALAGVEQEGILRVRLTLDRQGHPAVVTAPLTPAPGIWTLAVHEERLDPDDPWLRVKTNQRELYDRARAALPRGLDEWVFLNNRGEVCEGSITNIFVRLDGELLTPPVTCGLLPGILRRKMLAEGVRETVLMPEDLFRGELFVGNSLRGTIPARLVP